MDDEKDSKKRQNMFFGSKDDDDLDDIPDIGMGTNSNEDKFN